MIDPKKIEFSMYNNQKYMYGPVITESSDAVDALSLLAKEMDNRYEIFAENMVKNLAEYNERGDGHLPYIICVIDEFSDLMATDKEVEKDVMRIAQKARAAGIHLLLATQRPSVDVVTGVVKANFPTRLAYKVASRVDSQTILDTPGAENLIGRGDCLFLASDGNLKRLHGAYMPDDEIEDMLKPYAAKVKPWNFPQRAEDKKELVKSVKVTKTEKKESWLRKCWNFWMKLKVSDRKMVINAIKYIFTFIAGVVANNKTQKKNK
jgi:S-DNA-T family DNA segregation ATPase FtsK/SpoIIIE